MEFAAPERLSILEYILQQQEMIIVFVVLSLGAALFCMVLGSGSSKLGALATGLIVGIISSLFVGVIIGGEGARGEYIKNTENLITQTDSRVFLSEDSNVPLSENTPNNISLIAKDNGDVLSCQMILFSGDYKITCEDPATNNKMVSVDEALAAL